MNLPSRDDAAALAALLRWYLDMGVDWAVDEVSHDRFAESSAKAREANSPILVAPSAAQSGFAEASRDAPQANPARPSGSGAPAAPTFATAERSAREIAAGAPTLEALRDALDAFDGCALKRTATRLVFADGNPSARLMLIGEAPGAEEDRTGLPFVGRAGQLLDRMLAAIGLDRTQVYIANVVPWRPAGNRTPTPQETTICLPFVRRQIALVDPDILVALGGAAAQSLFGVKEGVTKIRGTWREFLVDGPESPRTIPAMTTLHPAYLLRTPAAKRLAWRDLIQIRKALNRHPQ